MTPAVRVWLSTLTVAGALLCSPTSAASAVSNLQGFSVSFAITYRGVRAGKSELVLTHQADDRWRYASSNRARGLFRLAFPEDIEQHSDLVIDESGPRPLRYRASDGSAAGQRDIDLHFDWQQRKISGIAEREKVSIDLGEVQVQDPMSVQLALMHALRTGATPDHYWIVDKTQLKRYRYRPEGAEVLKIANQNLATVIWTSQREGSDRLTRVWYAKDLGYLPVRAERRRGNRLEWSMLAEEYSLHDQVRGKVTPR